MQNEFRLLIVDDDPDDHLIFKEALGHLTNYRFEIVSVYDGQEMVAYLTGSTDFPQRPENYPDMIILDLTMPLVDGFTCMKALKGINVLKNIPVFIISGTDNPSDKEKCLEMGCEGFYKKPVQLADVEDIFRKMIDVTEHIVVG